MATPYNTIQKSFYSKFQSPTLIDPLLENEFFKTAVGDFELELSDINWNDDANETQVDLKRSEVNLLGTYMYKAYLEREIDRLIKLNNIVGRDISLTGMGDRKRVAMTNLNRIESNINSMTHKLKQSSYYDEG